MASPIRQFVNRLGQLIVALPRTSGDGVTTSGAVGGTPGVYPPIS